MKHNKLETECQEMGEVQEIHPQELTLPADPMISMIERVALDPNSDLQKLERMLELKDRHDAAEAKKAYAAAFATAATNFPTIPLNGKSNNGRYATLEDITKLTRPILAENGLALTFSIDVGERVIVTAKLMHKSGHCEETSMALPLDSSGSKNAVQSVGSSQTYGQRYTAQAILGLSLGDDGDDDGGAPQQTVSAEQFTKLRDLIEQSGADTAKFLKAYGTASLEQFPANKFAHASAALTRKSNATAK